MVAFRSIAVTSVASGPMTPPSKKSCSSLALCVATNLVTAADTDVRALRCDSCACWYASASARPTSRAFLSLPVGEGEDEGEDGASRADGGASAEQIASIAAASKFTGPFAPVEAEAAAPSDAAGGASSAAKKASRSSTSTVGSRAICPPPALAAEAAESS